MSSKSRGRHRKSPFQTSRNVIAAPKAKPVALPPQVGIEPILVHETTPPNTTLIGNGAPITAVIPGSSTNPADYQVYRLTKDSMGQDMLVPVDKEIK